LLSAASTSYAAHAAQARHELRKFAGDLRDVELQSQATTTEYLRLRDDARSASEAASSSTLIPQPVREAAAVAVTRQLDRSPLYGSLDAAAWQGVASRLSANLAALGSPQSLIDRTVADVRATADLAGVSVANSLTIFTDFDRYMDARSRLQGGRSSRGYGFGGASADLPDPSLYYTQHLRGFFRGFATEKGADDARLSADTRVDAVGPHAAAVLGRETRTLESLGAAVPSASGHDLDDAFASSFAAGPPTGPALAPLRARLVADLGATATASRTAAVDRLLADAPAFYRAAGASPQKVRTLVGDVKAVVDGGASSLNPFRVYVYPAPVDARTPA